MAILLWHLHVTEIFSNYWQILKNCLGDSAASLCALTVRLVKDTCERMPLVLVISNATKRKGVFSVM